MALRKALWKVTASLLLLGVLGEAQNGGVLSIYEALRENWLPAGLPSGETFVCPLDPPGDLHLHQNARCNKEIMVCRPLGLVYLHIFKTSGSSQMARLSEFCEATTGVKGEKISGWDELSSEDLKALKGRPCNSNFLCSSPGWTCYSTTRDPVDRFLSAHHEINKRRETIVVRTFLPALAENAPLDVKIDALGTLLALAERSPFDAHIASQSFFLPNNGSLVRLFKVEDGEEPVQDFLCGIYNCRNRKAGRKQCPRIRAGKERSRGETSYRVPQYDIKREEVPTEIVRRIEKLYAKDYCRFGYQPTAIDGSANATDACR